MKKKILFGIAILIVIFSAINFNFSCKQITFSQIFQNVEALAGSSEGEGKFKCGYSCYESGEEPESDSDVKKEFTRCSKDCPDDSGYNPKYKDCD